MPNATRANRSTTESRTVQGVVRRNESTRQPKVTLLFDGRKLSWMEDGQMRKSWNAVSGQKDFQDPKHQCKEYEGPIPEGTWFVKQSEHQEAKSYAEQHWFTTFLNKHIPGRTSWPWKTSSWGLDRILLVEDRLKQKCDSKRTQMYIHGGSNPGSAGCIDLTNQMSAFAKLFLAHGEDILLTVDYSTWKPRLPAGSPTPTPRNQP